MYSTLIENTLKYCISCPISTLTHVSVSVESNLGPLHNFSVKEKINLSFN